MPEQASSSSLAAKREMFLKLQKQKESNNKDRITPHGKKGKIPVSYIQEKMLNAEIKGLYNPEETRTLGPSLGYIIKGRINISVLHKTIQEIVRRHEVLRTNYIVIDNQSYQKINELPENILNIVDFNNLSETEKKDESNRSMLSRASESFSYLQDSLMITAMLITAKDEHMLLIITNHVATDGFSMGILQKELLVLYQTFLYNMPSPFPELPVQYADFALWERERFSEDFLDEKLAYWKQLPDPENSILPTDHKMPEPICYDGDTVPIVLLPELTRKLKKLSQECNVTLFTTLLAAFSVLIYRFSGYKYNLFSIPVANRTQKETESLIGCFMNFQFFHINFNENLNFLQIVDKTKKTLFDVFESYVPHNFILNNLPPNIVNFNFHLSSEGVVRNKNTVHRDEGTDLEFQDKNNEENSQIKDASSMSQGMMFIPLKIPQPRFAIFPIDANLAEVADTINGSFIYQKALYDRSTIVKLTNDYTILLSQIIKNPEIQISDMNIKPHKSIIA